MSRRRSQQASRQPSNSSLVASLTVGAALERGQHRLRARAKADAPREALFLLAGVLEMAPGSIALQRDRTLTAEEVAEYETRLARRAMGEPLQYVEGRAAFRQLHLRVNRAVLIPRPETEQLVESVLEWSRGREGLQAVDLGTGSGAIAISLVLEGPFASVVGVDISDDALNVARQNAAEAGVQDRVELRLGSLYQALLAAERFHVIVSNPPYIAHGEGDLLPAEVRDWEPPVALYAGPTGFEAIEEIVAGAPLRLRQGGLLALEVAPGVADTTLAAIRGQAGLGEPRVVRDLAGHRRIVLAERE